jgi:alanine racemase
MHNFNIIKNAAKGSKIMAVVKADAYGHSVALTVPVLNDLGADAFAVSNIEEALTLRNQGVNKPILILGYTPVNMANELADNDISQCVYCTEYAKALSEMAVKNNVNIKIHIKLVTGMSRLGFNCRTPELLEINEAISAASLKGFSLEGIFTHYAESDRTPDAEDGFTDKQFSLFNLAVERFKNADLNPKYLHTCNSAALLADNDKHLDFCRPGIILYGLTPSSSLKLKQDFKPVMTLKSVVSMVKEIDEDTSVSYGRTFKATKKTRIATVTAGYADGYPRLLSNKTYVLINGQRAKIVGRVCMDQLCVDITDIENVNIGDEVILFGKGLPVEELADLCGTINYEIVCGVSPRVPRIAVE